MVYQIVNIDEYWIDKPAFSVQNRVYHGTVRTGNYESGMGISEILYSKKKRNREASGNFNKKGKIYCVKWMKKCGIGKKDVEKDQTAI